MKMQKMQRKGSLMRNERGSAGTKAAVAFAILGAVVYAAITLIPMYADHWKFEDDLKNNILFANEKYRGVEGGVEKGLTNDIESMLKSMGATYDKKQVRVKLEQQKINVEVWYGRPHKLPFLQNPKQFYLKLENTQLKGL